MGILSIFSKKKKIPELRLPLPPPGLKKREHIPSELPDIKGSEVEISGPVPKWKPHPAPAKEAAPAFEIPPSAMAEEEKPIFVSVEDYKAMVDSADYIKGKLSDVEEIASKMNELKRHGDKELELWKSQLEDSEKKLAFIEEVLSQEG